VISFIDGAGENVLVTTESLSIFIRYLCTQCFLKFKNIILVLRLGIVCHPYAG